jgi:hypothetical protein
VIADEEVGVPTRRTHLIKELASNESPDTLLGPRLVSHMPVEFERLPVEKPLVVATTVRLAASVSVRELEWDLLKASLR